MMQSSTSPSTLEEEKYLGLGELQLAGRRYHCRLLSAGMNRQKVFHLIDEVRGDRDWEFLNEYIVSDPEFLRYRIEKDIDLTSRG